MGLLRTIRTLFALLMSALLAAIITPLERWLELFFWLPFIRTPAEALLRPKRFFAQLQRFGSVPRSAKLVRLEYDHSRHSLEPDKAALRAAHLEAQPARAAQAPSPPTVPDEASSSASVGAHAAGRQVVAN